MYKSLEDGQQGRNRSRREFLEAIAAAGGLTMAGIPIPKAKAQGMLENSQGKSPLDLDYTFQEGRNIPLAKAGGARLVLTKGASVKMGQNGLPIGKGYALKL